MEYAITTTQVPNPMRGSTSRSGASHQKQDAIVVPVFCRKGRGRPRKDNRTNIDDAGMRVVRKSQREISEFFDAVSNGQLFKAMYVPEGHESIENKEEREAFKSIVLVNEYWRPASA